MMARRSRKPAARDAAHDGNPAPAATPASRTDRPARCGRTWQPEPPFGPALLVLSSSQALLLTRPDPKHIVDAMLVRRRLGQRGDSYATIGGQDSPASDPARGIEALKSPMVRQMRGIDTVTFFIDVQQDRQHGGRPARR